MLFHRITVSRFSFLINERQSWIYESEEVEIFMEKKLISRELVGSQVDKKKKNISKFITKMIRVFAIALSICGFNDAKTATIISTRLPIIRERTVRN